MLVRKGDAVQKTLAVLAFVGLLQGVALAQEPDAPTPQTYRLDLTDPAVVRTQPMDVMRSSVEYIGKPTLPLPFEMRLQSIGRGTNDAADVVVYEVALKLTGTAAFDFPRSLDRVPIESGPRPFLEAVLSLEAEGPDQAPIAFAQEIILGSAATPGSIIRLRPGDTLVVRVPGSLLTTPDREDALRSAPTMRVRAMLRFDDGPRVTWQPLRSSNSQVVSFRP